jgi:hypothetical protein
MGTKYKILIMGASYGSLLGTKLALAGHSTHLICLPAEADLINKEGAIVRMPVKGRDALVEINSKKLPGKITAARDAGAAVPFARRARAPRRGRQGQGPLHVDHEHAAAALSEAHSGPQCRRLP